eukprot:364626-Chlamydomonas_euryale.AAC.2
MDWARSCYMRLAAAQVMQNVKACECAFLRMSSAACRGTHSNALHLLHHSSAGYRGRNKLLQRALLLMRSRVCPRPVPFTNASQEQARGCNPIGLSKPGVATQSAIHIGGRLPSESADSPEPN